IWKWSGEDVNSMAHVRCPVCPHNRHNPNNRQVLPRSAQILVVAHWEVRAAARGARKNQGAGMLGKLLRQRLAGRSRRHDTARWFRPRLERLEERECPAVFNIANGDTPALIAAINAANSNNQADTINLAAKGTYDFTTADNGASGGSALPVIVPDNNNP